MKYDSNLTRWELKVHILNTYACVTNLELTTKQQQQHNLCYQIRVAETVSKLTGSVTTMRCYIPQRGWPDGQHPIDWGLMSLLGQQRSAVVGSLPVHLVWTQSGGCTTWPRFSADCNKEITYCISYLLTVFVHKGESEGYLSHQTHLDQATIQIKLNLPVKFIKNNTPPGYKNLVSSNIITSMQQNVVW